MSIYTWGVIVLVALGIAWFGWALVAGGSLRQVEESTPLPMPRRKRGPLTEAFCPVCGQAGVYLTKRGLPNRRFHSCAASVNAPSVLVPFVQIDTGRPEPESVLTTAGWPPEGWPPEVAS